jgi:prepilin-type N-terminal cleavage/methylation domain-containing protein
MKHSRAGFTIVELLIVIVVIAILAAITIVAYNGIQERSRASAVSSALSQASKKLSLYQIDNPDQYPAAAGTDGTANLSALGISNSGNVTYQYSASGNTYCLTATQGATSYKVSSTTTAPSSGGCAGHGVGGQAPITNLANNPGSEVAALNIGNGGGATIARNTTLAHGGSASTLLTKGTGYAFARNGDTSSFGIGDETVTFSAWVNTSEPSILFVRRGGGVAYANYTKTVTPNTWTRVSQTFTIPTGATSFYIDIGWEAASAPTGAILYVDDVMATQGSTLYTYADGNSPNWAWNGTLNNSTSRGPAL